MSVISNLVISYMQKVLITKMSPTMYAKMALLKQYPAELMLALALPLLPDKSKS